MIFITFRDKINCLSDKYQVNILNLQTFITAHRILL